MTDQEILELPMQVNDSGATTVRGYFQALLTKLFKEEEGFSGKRPFGNSGWTWDLAPPLIKAGALVGTLDEYGYAEEFDEEAYNTVIFRLIESLGGRGDAMDEEVLKAAREEMGGARP